MYFFMVKIARNCLNNGYRDENDIRHDIGIIFILKFIMVSSEEQLKIS